MCWISELAALMSDDHINQLFLISAANSPQTGVAIARPRVRPTQSAVDDNKHYVIRISITFYYFHSWCFRLLADPIDLLSIYHL